MGYFTYYYVINLKRVLLPISALVYSLLKNWRHNASNFNS